MGLIARFTGWLRGVESEATRVLCAHLDALECGLRSMTREERERTAREIAERQHRKENNMRTATGADGVRFNNTAHQESALSVEISLRNTPGGAVEVLCQRARCQQECVIILFRTDGRVAHITLPPVCPRPMDDHFLVQGAGDGVSTEKLEAKGDGRA